MIKPQRVDITADAGARDSVRLNGEIIPAVSATLRLEAGSIAELTLVLDVYDGTADGSALCKVDDRTREALIAMGWTPPLEPPTYDQIAELADLIIKHQAEAPFEIARAIMQAGRT